MADRMSARAQPRENGKRKPTLRPGRAPQTPGRSTVTLLMGREGPGRQRSGRQRLGDGGGRGEACSAGQAGSGRAQGSGTTRLHDGAVADAPGLCAGNLLGGV